ncbi:MAG: DNA cytosine methyltransferase, partial [Spirochaetaceae bacterium]|nr:DNA cytosine methyltransferase [Spirochaetaceae bacterium]
MASFNAYHTFWITTRKSGYIIEYKLLNAVDYGVPQNRERLFAVGHRGKFRFPLP